MEINFNSKIKLSFYLFVSVIILSSSCKSTVDRNKAQQLIAESFKLPLSINKTLVTGDYIDNNPDLYSYTDLRHFNIPGYVTLINNGYMNINARVIPVYSNGWGHMCFNVTFTDKAKGFILNSTNVANNTVNNLVKICTVNFGSITTLREINENEYEVEFSLIESLTPIGDAYKQRVWLVFNDQENLFNDSEFSSLKVTILKYDTGWAISPDDIQRIQKMF